MTFTNRRFLMLMSLGAALIMTAQMTQPWHAGASVTIGPDCCQLPASSPVCFSIDAGDLGQVASCILSSGIVREEAMCVAETGICVPSTPGVCGDGVVNSETGEECDPPGDLCEPEVPGFPFENCLANCTCGFEVVIDIKPGSDPARINPASNGVIPVAILGSDTLDVLEVDVTTLAFGPTAAAPTHKAGGHPQDVNHDGVLDLLSHYRTPETGILPGDTEACVTGALATGTSFEACDSIQTVSNGGDVQDDPPATGLERIECGGHIAYTNNGGLRTSVRVFLKDNCTLSGEPSDSEITCRTVVNNPATEYAAIRVPDGQGKAFSCDAIPPGGGVFVICNGLEGDCLLKVFKPAIHFPDFDDD